MNRKTLAVLAAMTALTALTALTAVGGVAQAQPYGPPRENLVRSVEVDHRINWIQHRIVRGREDGALDRGEFDRVLGELNNIRHEEAEFKHHHDGFLDDRVVADLEGRLDQLNDQIHWMRQHDDRRPW